MNQKAGDKVVVIGGGPAGLTAAYQLAHEGCVPVLFEKRDQLGGIACTEAYQGFLFDMGGHRFFSRDESINEIWKSVLKDDFLLRSRLSRIYYKRKFLDYPLRPLNAFAGLGLLDTIMVIGSYMRWRLFPHPDEKNFARWVTNRFGKRLFEIFFKSYTEKVWGIPCTEISSTWAAQRIKNLSLHKAIANMLSLSRKHVRTLVDQFHYPRNGPSMMWNALSEIIENKGGEVHLEQEVIAVHRNGFKVTGVTVAGTDGEQHLSADQFISSMPITTLVKILQPAPPEAVIEAANQLRYRDFVTVCLIVDRPAVFPDQWIYIHDPSVKMGRIQNYKNWSPDMVPDAKQTGLGLEYFCTAGDSLWNTPDQALIDLGKKELEQMGLARRDEVIDGKVYRVPKAYPLYNRGYSQHLRVVRDFVDQLEDFQTFGRNGLFRYNNMDHSMITGIFAAENITHGARRDVWSINSEAQYLEEAKAE